MNLSGQMRLIVNTNDNIIIQVYRMDVQSSGGSHINNITTATSKIRIDHIVYMLV